MNVVQTVTVGLGIATGVAGLITFVVGFVTARSANQRQLRDRLRKQLREMNLACVVYFQREGWEAVNRSPQFSFQALDQNHEDGLYLAQPLTHRPTQVDTPRRPRQSADTPVAAGVPA